MPPVQGPGYPVWLLKDPKLDRGSDIREAAEKTGVT